MNSTYFLDTDICIFALKGSFPTLRSWFERLSPERIKIPSVVKAELLLGAHKSSHPQKTLSIVEDFLAPFEIIPFCDSCAVSYSKIRLELENQGHLIGPNDLLIAATASAHQGILVTHNTKEYSRIPTLKLQDWTQREAN